MSEMPSFIRTAVKAAAKDVVNAIVCSGRKLTDKEKVAIASNMERFMFGMVTPHCEGAANPWLKPDAENGWSVSADLTAEMIMAKAKEYVEGGKDSLELYQFCVGRNSLASGILNKYLYERDELSAQFPDLAGFISGSEATPPAGKAEEPAAAEAPGDALLGKLKDRGEGTGSSDKAEEGAAAVETAVSEPGTGVIRNTTDL